jgi:hypothetical protein
MQQVRVCSYRPGMNNPPFHIDEIRSARYAEQRVPVVGAGAAEGAIDASNLLNRHYKKAS